MKKNLSLTQKNRIAQKEHESLLKWKDISAFSFLYIGKFLKKIRDDKLYLYLGKDSPEFESFAYYVASPDVNFELRKAYYLIEIYEKFCVQLKYKPEDLKGLYWTTLRSILGVVEEKNADEWVEKAKTLTRGHLEMEVKANKSGLKTLEDLNKHEHTWEKITFWKCNICGETSKFKPADGKIIK